MYTNLEILKNCAVNCVIKYEIENVYKYFYSLNIL